MIDKELEPLAREARKYGSVVRFANQVKHDIGVRNMGMGRPGVAGWAGVSYPRDVEKEFNKTLAKRVMDAGIGTDEKSLKSFYSQAIIGEK